MMALGDEGNAAMEWLDEDTQMRHETDRSRNRGAEGVM